MIFIFHTEYHGISRGIYTHLHNNHTFTRRIFCFSHGAPRNITEISRQRLQFWLLLRGHQRKKENPWFSATIRVNRKNRDRPRPSVWKEKEIHRVKRKEPWFSVTIRVRRKRDTPCEKKRTVILRDYPCEKEKDTPCEKEKRLSVWGGGK